MAELTAISGQEGNFEVQVLQNPRYVEMEKCIACGLCSEKCPKKIPDEYNEGLAPRKAAHVQYAQAVPLKYVIDSENCLYFQKGKCRLCEKFCPNQAVNFEDQPKELSLRVGSIIFSSGFQCFDPTLYDAYAYARMPNVVTAMEFERLLAASGPFMGHLVRPSDNMEPKKIAWLQCVGSRDLNHCDHGYCSSVCCMYAIKEAIIAKEHSKDPVDCTVFFMDIRSHGKDFERYYNKAKEEGIRFIRSRIHSVDPDEEESGLLITYVTEDGRLATDNFDLVVLSVGMETPKESIDLYRKWGVALNANQFIEKSSFNPVETSIPGLYACGAIQGPKDIPQSVVEASAAACAAARNLAPARNTLIREKQIPIQRVVAGERPRIGVFVCDCGINIAGVVRVPEVAEYAKTLPYVEYVGENLFSCSQDTQEKIKEVIRENRLNRIVVAACTPRTHEPLFQETLVDSGLNKYLFEMANIRNQDSWVHSNEPEAATIKAKDLVRMAVSKATLLEPLQDTTVEVTQAGLVVGGGLSGLIAALELADQGYQVFIVEKAPQLGGNALSLNSTWRNEDIQGYLQGLIHRVEDHPKIKTYLNHRILDVDGFVGKFSTKVVRNDDGAEPIELNHGIVVIATGASELKPTEYLYGQDPRVVTHLELDRKMAGKDPLVEKAKSVVFIQCVGSREPDLPYCSRVCCTHSIHSALQLKEEDPDRDIYILYRDLRTYGEREEIYKQARQAGIVFIRYSLDHKPKVSAAGDGLNITVLDPILSREIQIQADLVGLAGAIVSHRDHELAQMFKVPLNEDGFFVEAHAKLRPVDFATDGVFLCGMAHYPKPVDESIAQAQAAVARAITLLSGLQIEVSGTVALINPAICSRCGVCVAICPYSAPGWNEKTGKAEINPALCKGCGLCVASCRSGALTLKGFNQDQIFAMIDAA
ncbi:MAG: CoB--CoM heterodisulfide reductase iron-sulfur subunit A family protein [Desulfobacteraceae bacterium]|nr:MAG: CoB--CoM heterodisulfide reductase iron-sulfur subunit A family protein [Desulfobacteraceae bacterium]